MENEYEKWIKKAEKDLDTAKYLINGEREEEGLFFLQQSAEKSLKAVYIKKFGKLLKTHDLVLLARKVNAPENIHAICKRLTLSYQYTRYPDVIKKNAEEEIKEFMKDTTEIIKWTKRNL